MRREKDNKEKVFVHVEVDNCTRLNIREYPRSNASVNQIVDKGCHFLVLKTALETKELYPAVYDSDKKLVGFAMRDYLKEVKEERDEREHTELN